MTLGERLRALRTAKKLTQEELANLLGIGRSNYGHIENNRVSLESDYATILADKLNTSVEYILTGEGDIEVDPDIRTLQRAAKKMTPEERKKAIKILEATFDDLFGDED